MSENFTNLSQVETSLKATYGEQSYLQVKPYLESISATQIYDFNEIYEHAVTEITLSQNFENTPEPANRFTLPMFLETQANRENLFKAHYALAYTASQTKEPKEVENIFRKLLIKSDINITQPESVTLGDFRKQIYTSPEETLSTLDISMPIQTLDITEELTELSEKYPEYSVANLSKLAEAIFLAPSPRARLAQFANTDKKDLSTEIYKLVQSVKEKSLQDLSKTSEKETSEPIQTPKEKESEIEEKVETQPQHQPQTIQEIIQSEASKEVPNDYQDVLPSFDDAMEFANREIEEPQEQTFFDKIKEGFSAVFGKLGKKDQKLLAEHNEPRETKPPHTNQSFGTFEARRSVLSAIRSIGDTISSRISSLTSRNSTQGQVLNVATPLSAPRTQNQPINENIKIPSNTLQTAINHSKQVSDQTIVSNPHSIFNSPDFYQPTVNLQKASTVKKENTEEKPKIDEMETEK